MGYFYLILQALIFSFGGLLIKSVGTMLSPFLTSCLRFTIGTPEENDRLLLSLADYEKSHLR